MNTKQKLTLGIAAIFMVTLTIVGVTYAYFVTRVTTEKEATATITAAQIGSIEYKEVGDNGKTVSLTNMIPGDDVEDVVYKSFSVINKGETAGYFDVTLTSSVPELKPSFMHSGVAYANDTTNSEVDKTTLKNACYVADTKNSLDTTPTAACFVADADYDNIVYTLYELTEGTLADVYTTTTFNAATKTAVEGASGKVSSTSGAAKVITTKRILIPGSAKANTEPYSTKNYILKVEYINRNANQNVENEAALDITVSIK